ncbi:hypothetical protein K9U39_03660 [Rhodoblastus acidophilus]|uniref:Cytochrome c domain-containing protein n=1 Tax=Candidatus Rhodoblastus alkanivorans TaxID=2954117 RepID=A0ABS9Z7U8_9HYPH|nr:hypothetical protein [Candidatus Rhodoblastus alkanivorans]MCI4680264.1 hypothetical protein [Candidatus Rhodoblastus alkanivorans]MCI4682747.1 hypothetical protein [Candidatus Rhodoblastus alkanivorans]MDI4640054.1 hypothetical protein [Rhodoblastus acidophilus]
MRLTLAVVFSCLAFGAAAAENAPAPGPAAPATAAPAPAAYSPGLSDIMSGAQWRHLKLGYAGEVKNWPLAAFEAAQMRNNFVKAAQYFPEFEKVPVAKLIKQFSEPALDEVDAAIKARNATAFLQSFGRLTEACNSCHKAAAKGFIKIRVPTSSPFSNQVFPPGP